MRDGYKIVDADVHVVEPMDLFEKRLPDKYKAITKLIAPGGPEQASNYDFTLGDLNFSPRNELVAGQALRRFSSGTRNDTFMAAANRNPTPALIREGMEAAGIDVAAIVPTFTFIMTAVDNLPADHALALCRAYNDWCAELVSADRERFRFWGWLPRQDPELAAAEAIRCVKELGADGVGMITGAIDGKLLSNPIFEPLWEEVSKLNVPMGLHLWGSAKLAKDDIGHRYWDQPHGLGPYTVLIGIQHAMSCLVELIYSGALERHPKLRPLIMEADNGWLLFLLDRMDEKWELYEEEFKNLYKVELPIKPSDYFKRQCFITCEGEEHALKYLVDYGLGDNIVFSTDYPHHDSGWPDCTNKFLGQDMSAEAKRKILWDNSLRCFGWDETGKR